MAKEKALAQSVKPAKIEDYEVEDALRTLERVEDLKSRPELMSRVKKLAGRKMKTLKGIASLDDLRKVYDDKYGSGARKKG